ncbi:L-aspartate 1-decarboxylase [Lentibacillus halodurans]|uniref:Aspartate 1-decarboxylase n=1 Tax=Lentibacillus halodurans TaxID=237679 RepID=A0A1I0XF09_9BACI|nr:aspartate 1-decarboxylase [Lentibacillus halodurans]SFA99287.1 L-aspartate 1-decarboxylase [Lentibacillus halodurans]
MQQLMCKGKLHRVRVTEAELDYVGSVTIDSKFMKEADIKPYEMVQITSLKNATRWKTYAIPAPEGSKRICLNGPPAHLFSPGDIVIILSMAQMTEEEIENLKPKVVFFDENNEITSIEEHDLHWPEGVNV